MSANLSDPIQINDAEPVSVQVTIGQKRYILREAKEDAARIYRNTLTACGRFGPDGKFAGISGPINDAGSALLAACLFELYEEKGEAKERPCIISQVRSWPARVVKPLVDRAIAISHLQEKPDRKALQDQLESTQQAIKELDDSEGGLKNSHDATASYSS